MSATQAGRTVLQMHVYYPERKTSRGPTSVGGRTMAADPHADLLGEAAIVCGHIATQSAWIHIAQRDEPQAAGDSGWQFVCGWEAPENEDDAQVWSVAEVLAYDPTLKEWINSPPGTRLTRKSSSSSWVL